MHTLDGGRIGIAAQALGLAEGALERTIEYTKERKQFGRTIAQQQNTQFQLANMATKVEAAKNLVYKAALKKQQFADGARVSYSVEAAMAKLFAAEVAMEVTTKCVQLLGGYGYIREYDVERMMRDAKITEIYEGTSEVQRMVISGALFEVRTDNCKLYKTRSDIAVKIVVCIKQVPDTKGGVKFNPDGTLDRGAMLAIMNPDDKAGLEAALRIKDETWSRGYCIDHGSSKG